ncbi:MAG: hypothetical protein IJ180_09610 [Bacteroidales bacterium]|nr:hypothetical protein [Bacteroidales bacterium]
MSRGIGIRLLGDFEPEVNVVKDTEGKIEMGLVVGSTLEQNQALILLCHKGENKEFSGLGVGIEDMLNDHELEDWKRMITYMLSMDGMKIKELKLSETEIKLEADYE